MTLPKLLLEPHEPSYSLAFANEVLSVAVNNGPSRRRRDFIGAPVMASVTFIVTDAGYQYFNSFYRSSIADGVLPFRLDLILDDAAVDEYECAFVAGSVAMAAKAGEAYTISATLEVKRKPADLAADAAVVEIYELFGPAYSLEFSELAHLVNVTLPEAFPE